MTQRSLSLPSIQCGTDFERGETGLSFFLALFFACLDKPVWVSYMVCIIYIIYYIYYILYILYIIYIIYYIYYILYIIYIYYIYYIYKHITAYETIHHIIIYVMQSMWSYHSHFEDLLPHSFGGCS